MKLRIRDNSIRLRLTQTEVTQAGEEGVVRGTVSFGGGGDFEYVLRGSQDSDARADFSGNALTVSVPQGALRQWAESEQVSLSGSQPVGGGGELAILVEKDFACLAPREGEDESDMFPHPEAGKADC